MRPWIEHYGVWEPIEASFIRGRLKPGMTLLDIGANVGYFSILGARAVGPSGTVVAIEPEPANYALLCANIWDARVAVTSSRSGLRQAVSAVRSLSRYLRTTAGIIAASWSDRASGF